MFSGVHRWELGGHIYKVRGVPSSEKLPSSGHESSGVGKTDVTEGGMEGVGEWARLILRHGSILEGCGWQ